MADQSESELVKRLRKCSVAVYLATEEGPAKDISDNLREAASALSRAEQDIAALVRMAYAADVYYRTDKWPLLLRDALASLPPHLSKRIKEMDR